MKKLSVEEIKGLIAEKGSNEITVEVQVPKQIFSLEIDAQKRAIAVALFGTTSIDIKSYFMSPVPAPNVGYINVITINVTLEISDEALEEIELLELLYQKRTANSYRIEKPLPVAELKELMDNGTESFIVELYCSDYSTNKDLTGMLSDMVTNDFRLRDLHHLLLTQNVQDSFFVELKVTSPTVKEQIEKKYNFEQRLHQLHEDPFGSSVEYLVNPLTAEEMTQKFPNLSQENYFEFLINVPYDTLRNEESYYMKGAIIERIFKSSEVFVKSLRERPVGFDNSTQSVIVLVNGYVSKKES